MEISSRRIMHYDLRHPKCGAKWQAEYDKAPKEIQCIECGQVLPSIYDPIIHVARLPTTEERKN